MFLHVRLQLTYSHAWACAVFGLRWSTRPWIVSVVIRATSLWIIMIIYMTHLLDGCDHTWVYLSILTGWLCPCLGSGLLYTLLWMAAPIPHIYHVFETSFVLLHTGFPKAEFSVGHVLVKHFTPLSLSWASCFKGHLLHINLSPSLQSLSRTLEGSFCDLWAVT